jgi:hypothetical protein
LNGFKNGLHVDDKKDNIPSILKIFITLMVTPVFMGVGLGHLLRSLIVKITVTFYTFLKNPMHTLLHIPLNYKEQLLLYDTYYSPELLPEISKKDSTFSLFGIWDEDWFIKYTIAPFFALAYLYRWSIKSTAWFYFPLVFLTEQTNLQNAKKRKTAIDLQTDKKRVWFHKATFIALILYYFGDTFTTTIENAIPKTKALFGLLEAFLQHFPLIAHFIHPYSIYILTITLPFSFYIWWFADEQKLRRADGNPESSDETKTVIFWLIRLRLMLWYSAFSITLYSIGKKYIGDILDSIHNVFTWLF